MNLKYFYILVSTYTCKCRSAQLNQPHLNIQDGFSNLRHTWVHPHPHAHARWDPRRSSICWLCHIISPLSSFWSAPITLVKINALHSTTQLCLPPTSPAPTEVTQICQYQRQPYGQKQAQKIDQQKSTRTQLSYYSKSWIS